MNVINKYSKIVYNNNYIIISFCNVYIYFVEISKINLYIMYVRYLVSNPPYSIKVRAEPGTFYRTARSS